MPRPSWIERIRDQRHNGYGFVVKLKRGFSFTNIGYNRVKEFSSKAEMNAAIKIENIFIYTGEKEVFSIVKE